MKTGEEQLPQEPIPEPGYQLPYRTLVMAALGLLTGVTILFGIFIWKTFTKVLVPGSTTTEITEIENKPEEPQPFSIALLGYGGNGHAGGLLTDTIIVAHIRPVEKTITLITLPRDLWVNIPSNGEQETGWKINAAYAIGSDDQQYRNKPTQFTGESGGGALAKYAIGKVVGFPIDSFVAVSFVGFTETVDLLDGLDVQVEKTFDDYWYPIEGEEENTCGRSPEDIAALSATMSGYLLEQQFPCRYEHLHFDQGLTSMDGETALKYARSRHSSQDGSDFGRSQRQKQVILAAKKKALSLNLLPKIIPLMNSLGQNLRTDLSLEIIQDFITNRNIYGEYTVNSIALTDQNVLAYGRSANGQYILTPREGDQQWTAIHEWIQQQIENPNATPEAELIEKQNATHSASTNTIN